MNKMDGPENGDLDASSADTQAEGGCGVDGRPHEKCDEERSFLEGGSADGIGYWGAVAHMIRATVGTGVFLLPHEMKSLGYVTGTLLLLAVAAVYYHIIHILLYLDARLRAHLKTQRLTYALIADHIFARAPPPLRRLRVALLCVIYVYYAVPTGKSISLVVVANNVVQTAKFFGTRLDATVVTTVLAAVLTALCMRRSLLAFLVPFSSTTNVCTFAMAAVVAAYAAANRLPAAAVRPFGDARLALRASVIFFNSVLATDIVLPLKNGMRQPDRLAGALGAVNATAAAVVALYAAFALVGYLCFGEAVRLNVLDNVPVNDLLMVAINVAYSLALCVSYVLSFYACFDVVWCGELQPRLAGSRYAALVECAVRVAFNAFAYALAVGVSNMALISALGGIIGVLLDVVFMPLLHIMLMCILDEKDCATICKNVLLAAISLALFFVTVVDCVADLRKSYGW